MEWNWNNAPQFSSKYYPDRLYPTRISQRQACPCAIFDHHQLRRPSTRHKLPIKPLPLVPFKPADPTKYAGSTIAQSPLAPHVGGESHY
jgi:hypothetical protein